MVKANILFVKPNFGIGPTGLGLLGGLGRWFLTIALCDRPFRPWGHYFNLQPTFIKTYLLLILNQPKPYTVYIFNSQRTIRFDIFSKSTDKHIHTPA